MARRPGRRGTTPQGRGRFPGFDVLDEVPRWDDLTAGVVLQRLAPATDLSFFTEAEGACARRLCDLLLAQDGEPRVPVVAMIDERLAIDETDGWRYHDMPEDTVAWRQTLAAVDEDARAAQGDVFAVLSAPSAGALVQGVFDAGQRSEHWHDWPAAHVWSLWTRYACAAFYSHPWAWNEIGFGGPAYPRGYKNVGVDKAEPWEVTDHDERDPQTFSARVEQARAEHRDLTGAEPATHGRTSGRQGGQA